VDAISFEIDTFMRADRAPIAACGGAFALIAHFADLTFSFAFAAMIAIMLKIYAFVIAFVITGSAV
jgi:hypothetical protein